MVSGAKRKNQRAPKEAYGDYVDKKCSVKGGARRTVKSFAANFYADLVPASQHVGVAGWQVHRQGVGEKATVFSLRIEPKEAAQTRGQKTAERHIDVQATHQARWGVQDVE